MEGKGRGKERGGKEKARVEEGKGGLAPNCGVWIRQRDVLLLVAGVLLFYYIVRRVS